MSPPSRRDRRSDYRNFPAAYGELFMLCRDGERHTIGPFDTERAARAAARDLYRYRGFLRTAVETDHSDVFARQIHDVARDLKIEVMTAGDGKGGRGGLFSIVLALNPIVAAVARLTTTAGKARSVTVSVPPNPDRAKHGVASERGIDHIATIVHQAIDGRDPDHSRSGIFIHHNCWRCKSGAEPCAVGNPNDCEYPQARND